MSHWPNIVFILADNVGYGVLSCYNGGILDADGDCRRNSARAFANLQANQQPSDQQAIA